ncbi:MAG: DNA recombination protein RmuC [Robiginitomaculum sp.]|nr:DNA recombination protein RmuC [Robiginitomaculum sp.]
MRISYNSIMQEQLTNIALDPVAGAMVVGIVVIVFAIVVLIVILRRGSGQQALLARLADNQVRIEGAFSSLLETAQTGNSDLKRNLEERLDLFGKRMGDNLSQNREQTHDNLKSLGERLAVIDRAQKNIEALGHEVSGLQSILANKQTRGAFGEMRMQDMIEDSLPASAYKFQETLSNGKRVDCLIFPPNGAEAIPVDAKFPLESWRNLQNAPDPAAKKQAAAAMRTDIKKHVNDIANKYIVPGETTDTALLFLPSEAIYADLHGHFPDLIEMAFRKRVMIVSPTTFMAALHTISSLMKDARMREQASLIQREVGRMMDDVRRLEDRAKKLDNRFKLTEQAVDDILKSTTGIARHAERISAVDVTPKLPATDEPALRLVTTKIHKGENE